MDMITRLLPLWAVMASLMGYLCSPEVAQFKDALIPIVALVMFSMGLTLTLKDFIHSIQSPLPLILGIALQFLMMPLLAWLLSLTLDLSPELMVGMVLVGSAPGGTASNVLTYLAGGRVALSLGMTIVSTLLSVLVTPLLAGVYLNEVVEVDRMAMLISIVQMILIPVCGGMLVRAVLPEQIEKLMPLLPICAVICISLAIGIVVALNANVLGAMSFSVVLAVMLHNLLGLFAGYSLARLFGQDIATSRTIAIEVGTQNSGMSAALAVKHFSAIAGIPSALFSIFQNVMGTVLASHWQKQSTDEKSLDP